jgi:hypothetical protein
MQGSCPFAFAILSVDPERLESRVVLEHEGSPFGGATVAVAVGPDLYLGTFAGDRIARARGAALSPHGG